MTDKSPSPSDRRERMWGALTQDALTQRPRLGHGYDEVLVALARTARDTRLGEYFPFTSMSRLCFAATPWPFEDIQAAYVEFDPSGHLAVYRALVLFPWVK